jgi:hypothetical protein
MHANGIARMCQLLVAHYCVKVHVLSSIRKELRGSHESTAHWHGTGQECVCPPAWAENHSRMRAPPATNAAKARIPVVTHGIAPYLVSLARHVDTITELDAAVDRVVDPPQTLISGEFMIWNNRQ